MASTKNTQARRAAFEAGKTRYYTGEPCKHGHVAERFVSSGGCVKCVAPYKRTRNAFDKKAVPFVMAGLWVRASYDEAQRASLAVYLQQCIDTFDRATCPNEAPLMYDKPPAQILSPTTAPPGAATLPPLESLPSGDRPRARAPKCEHGIDEGFCNICADEDDDEAFTNWDDKPEA